MSLNPLRFRDFFFISIFWFALSFHWGGLQSFVFPKVVLRYVTQDQQGTYLGILSALGALISLLTNPLAGFLSDRSAHPLGRRRPYILWGTVFNMAALIFLAKTSSYYSLIFAVLLIQLFANISQAACAALIPDLVPKNQRGIASSFMGICQFLGNGFGFVAAGGILGGSIATAGMDPLMALMLLVALMLAVCGAFTMFGVHETPVKEKVSFTAQDMLRESFSVGDILKKPSFGWLMACRFFVNMGIFSVQVFLYYYVKDVLREKNVELATQNIMVMALVGALPSAIVSGLISDRTGKRKVFVYGSCVAMVFVSLFFMQLNTYRIALGIGLLFGLAFGAFMTVDWALACDLLPETDTAAKHMGIWNYAGVGPQVIAPAVGGVLLDQFNRLGPNLGYKAIFASVIVYLILGTFSLKHVKEGE